MRSPIEHVDAPPPRPRSSTLWDWLVTEAIFHLLPWGRLFWKRPIAFQAAGIGLAIVVTAVWILAAAGDIAPAVVVGWWTGWSVYEAIVRSYCKPWVKEGPWWRQDFRPASRADLLAYVATKNLLIGVALFLVLNAFGMLD